MNPFSQPKNYNEMLTKIMVFTFCVSLVLVAVVAHELPRAWRFLHPTWLTFTIEAHVWSWGASIETRVNNPIFNLYVDTFSLPVLEYGISASFQPGAYASYHLTFATADKATIAAVQGASSCTVRISVDALVNAGFYSEERVSSDSSTIMW